MELLETYAQIVVQSLDNGERKVIVNGAATLAMSRQGTSCSHAVGALLAAPFDFAGLK
jgi:hypothetical protein